MKHHIQKTIILIGLTVVLLGTTSCTTTRKESGVMIESKRSFNPLNYIPGL